MSRNFFEDKKVYGYIFMLFFIVLIFIMIFLLSELYLRFFNPQPIIPRYVTASNYGVRMNYPNINIWHTTPDYRVNIRTNNKGIRSDRNISYDKKYDVYRVVVVGDSFTMGYGVNVEDLYISVAERILKQKGYNVEFVNLGVSGFSTAEELVVLETEGFKYHPDMVVLAYFQNDLSGNIVSDLYNITNGTLVRDKKEYLPKIKERDFLYSFRIYRYLAEHSQLLYLVREKLSGMVYRSLYKMRSAKVHSDTSYEQELGAMLIDKIYKDCEERNVSFILLDIPSRDLVTNIPLERMIYKNNVTYINSSDILENKSHYLLYWKHSHGHWTPLAHHVVGKYLAEVIERYINGVRNE